MMLPYSQEALTHYAEAIDGDSVDKCLDDPADALVVGFAT